ncbi:MAG: diacylglycerol kinase [Desulfovibrio sp.]|nr:diacylglycerol kinase [Desulfovibrio sp.]MBI4958401.1 diacylglycerol kinase [Desulfovibrio sp.]
MKQLSIIRRVLFACQGIVQAWRYEASFRTHCLATLFVVLVLIWKQPEPLWWAILLFTCAAVLAAELLNTALEHTLDHLSPQEHPAVGIAKDCAAGAVLILSVGALAVFIAFLAET